MNRRSGNIFQSINICLNIWYWCSSFISRWVVRWRSCFSSIFWQQTTTGSWWRACTCTALSSWPSCQTLSTCGASLWLDGVSMKQRPFVLSETLRRCSQCMIDLCLIWDLYYGFHYVSDRNSISILLRCQCFAVETSPPIFRPSRSSFQFLSSTDSLSLQGETN